LGVLVNRSCVRPWLNCLTISVSTKTNQDPHHQVVDLKEKKVGISIFRGAYDLVARMILKHHGIDPEKQATLLQIGDSGTLYSALSAGTIDSAILGPTYDIKAELEGNNRLFFGKVDRIVS
jgi:ABC-type nitrate/sulfonate/bicarbonate transport system substrate-binding protein